MRKLSLLLIPLILLACQTLAPTGETPRSNTATPTAPDTVTFTPTALPSPSATPTLALPTISPPQTISAEGITVYVHPEDALYAGDQVSFEVVFNRPLEENEKEVVITLEDGSQLGPAGIGIFGIARRSQATLQWLWDTTPLEPGEHTLTFSILPRGLSWTETYSLHPTGELTYPSPDAEWITTESDCCIFYFVSDTAAARDIETLMDTADEQAELARERIGGGEFEEPITVVFMSRVLGHGGFATGDVYISYLDRNYAGNAPTQVLHHEMIHVLDGRLGGNLRPTLFVEGLAVYLSGGHFKPEPLLERAAEAVDLGWYLPLSDLANNFYPSQHELSYLEAASLIEYMVDTWGWDTFNDFYRSIVEHPSGLQSAAINQALITDFGLTFEQLEAQFVDTLNVLPDNPALEDDIRLTVTFFDTVRRYQERLDPSAYFMTAWLLGINEMRENGIVADYVRHPSTPENIALEALLVEADASLRAGDYAAAELALEAVNAVLDAYDAGNTAAFYAHPLASDYLALVEASLEAGHVPEKIQVDGEISTVWARGEGMDLVKMVFIRQDVGWRAE